MYSAAASLILAAATTALAAAPSSVVDGDRTAAVYVQPISIESRAPVQLAEIKWSTKPTAPHQQSRSDGADGVVEPPPEAQVLSYEAPELAELFFPGSAAGGGDDEDEDDEGDDGQQQDLDLQNLFLRVGLYDPARAAWTSATTVARASNLAKGYAPMLALTVSPPATGLSSAAAEDGAAGGEALAVALQGVAIDAGHTRDFGPQVRLLRQQAGRQVDLGKPVSVPAGGAGAGAGGFQGAGKEPEEKTLLQKYWWVLAIMVVLSLSGGGGEEEKKKK